MNSNQYVERGTLEKVANQSINHQKFEGYKVIENTLFTSSSLHNYKRTQPS